MKKINRLAASTRVVIRGEAAKAGSTRMRWANSGKMQPIDLAMTTVQNKLAEITADIMGVAWLINSRRTKVTDDSAMPIRMPTRNSVHRTRKKSENLTSPKAMPRMISVEAC